MSFIRVSEDSIVNVNRIITITRDDDINDSFTLSMILTDERMMSFSYDTKKLRDVVFENYSDVLTNISNPQIEVQEKLVSMLQEYMQENNTEKPRIFDTYILGNAVEYIYKNKKEKGVIVGVQKDLDSIENIEYTIATNNLGKDDEIFFRTILENNIIKIEGLNNE